VPCVNGFEELLTGQRQYLDDFWRRSDVQVSLHADVAGTTREQVRQTIRFNLYHVLQAAARAEDHGVPANGLMGQAYKGQYFWMAMASCCSIQNFVMTWHDYAFPLTFRGQQLEVDMEPITATYLPRQVSELMIAHLGEEVGLSAGHPVSLKIKAL
jgi:trehalose/maltose hydrolase-like predicted phosphorylase